jgi:hypothetical protein
LHEQSKEPSNNANKSENTNATSKQAGKGTWQARRLLYTRTHPLRIHSCGCQFGSENEEEHVILQVRLQIIQQLLPACAQPLLWSSAQAWQRCKHPMTLPWQHGRSAAVQ